MEIVEEQQINFEEFKRALDLLDITLLEPRAMRLFEAADLQDAGRIGITEFQVALMMNDGNSSVLSLRSVDISNEIGAPDLGLTAKDAFHMFDVERTGTMTKTAFPRVMNALKVGRHLPGKTNDSEERKLALESLFEKINRDKTGHINKAEFKAAWIQLVDVDNELKKRNIKLRQMPKIPRVPLFRLLEGWNRHDKSR